MYIQNLMAFLLTIPGENKQVVLFVVDLGFQDSTLVLTWASKIGIKVNRIYILGCQLNMTPN
jgi:hypothetical protein